MIESDIRPDARRMATFAGIGRGQVVRCLARGGQSVVTAVTTPRDTDVAEIHTKPIRCRGVAGIARARRNGVTQIFARCVNAIMAACTARRNIAVVKSDARPRSNRMAGLTIRRRRQMARPSARSGRPVMTGHAIRRRIGVYEMNIRPGNSGGMTAVARLGGGNVARRFAGRVDTVVAARAGALSASMVKLNVQPGRARRVA